MLFLFIRELSNCHWHFRQLWGLENLQVAVVAVML